jgi:hypothetical protein
MAEAAYRRAANLSDFGSTVVGVAATCALATVRAPPLHITAKQLRDIAKRALMPLALKPAAKRQSAPCPSSDRQHPTPCSPPPAAASLNRQFKPVQPRHRTQRTAVKFLVLATAPLCRARPSAASTGRLWLCTRALAGAWCP